MRNNTMEGNKGSLLWVLIVVLVILMAAAAVAIKFMPTDPAPEPRSAVSRAKVPPPPPSPAPTPEPQVMAAAATPAGESQNAEASPSPGPLPSPQAGKGIATDDLKTADAAPTQQKPAATPAEASPTPEAAPFPTPAPQPKAAEKKQQTQSLARMDLDQMAPYTIQVGAFLKKANADQVLSQLTQKGYAPFIFQITDAQQRSFYMVRFGQFGSREQAAKTLEAFKQKEKMAAVIVRSGMM